MSAEDKRRARTPDVAVGAAAKARKLRFKTKPRTKVEHHGKTRVRTESGVEELAADGDSHSERKNLPEEVEPGVTYRDVEIGWVAGARIADPDDRGADEEDRV
jgi:hypothetical protein